MERRLERNRVFKARTIVSKLSRRRFLSGLAARTLPGHRAAEFRYKMTFHNDIQAVAFPFAKETGRVPDFLNPIFFAEKLRAASLRFSNPLMGMVSDKIAVRRFQAWSDVSLAPAKLISVYEDDQEISVRDLPSNCVLKISNGSSQHLFHTSENPLTEQDIVAARRKWRADPHWMRFGELVYKDLPSRVLVEEYLPHDQSQLEYKVHCFNGEPHVIGVVAGRVGSSFLRAVYTPDWRSTTYGPGGFRKGPDIEEPKELGQILDIARCLSRPFPHARIDFLHHNERLALGEVTLMSAAMKQLFGTPEEDRRIAERIDMSRMPEYQAEGRRICQALDWSTETSWGHWQDDPRLATGGF